MGAATFAGSAQFGQFITMSSTQAEYGYLNLGAASVYGWQIGKAPSSGGIAGNESFYIYNFSNSTVPVEIDTSNNFIIFGQNNGYDGTLQVGARAYFQHRDAGQTTTSILSTYNNDDTTLNFRLKGVSDADAQMTIKGSGKVGIGTASPGATLDVNGATYVRNVIYGYAGAGNQYGGLSWGGTDEGFLFLKDSNVTKVNINSNGDSYFNGGNVGIGTTTPDAKLSVGPEDGTNELRFLVDNDDTGVLGVYNDDQASNYNQVDNGYVLQVGTRGGNPGFKSIEARGYCAFATQVGNVGIGTSSPGSKLEVNGTGQFGGVLRVPAQWDSSLMAGNSIYAATANDGFAFGVGTGISTWWSYSNTSGIRRMIDVDNDGTFVRIRTSQVDRVIVDSTGNVGIRDTSPSATLHLGPGGTSQVGIKVQGNSSSTVENILSYNTQAAGTGWYHLVGQYYSGGYANAIIIYGNGNVLNLNNSYGQISDEKLKENISDATPKLEDIKKLKVKNFNFKGDDLKQIGMIAQDVEEIFPGLVEEVTDPKTKEKSKSLKYSVTYVN